jgi:hypothetical protein
MYVFSIQYLNTRVTLPFPRAKDVCTASSCHLNHAHKIYYTSYKIKCKLLYKAQNVSFLYWLREVFYLMILSIAQFMYIEHQWSVNKCKYRAVAKWYRKGKPEVLREKSTGLVYGAVWYWHVETDVSKEHSASIIRIILSTWFILGGVDKLDLRRFLYGTG